MVGQRFFFFYGGQGYHNLVENDQHNNVYIIKRATCICPGHKFNHTEWTAKDKSYISDSKLIQARTTKDMAKNNSLNLVTSKISDYTQRKNFIPLAHRHKKILRILFFTHQKDSSKEKVDRFRQLFALA